MATQEQKEAFIELIAEPVIKECKKRGWGVPSAIIAQAAIESGWNTSGLSIICNNFWGMKWREGCGTDYKEFDTKEQKIDGSYYSIKARFRKWSTPAAGVVGYFDFIESYKRYAPVMRAKTFSEYAVQIKACGWATSLNYITTIINTVNNYNLNRFDNLNIKYNDGENYILDANLYIRQSPYGDKIKHTCISDYCKEHSKFDDYGNAILQKGTKITCAQSVELDDSLWILIDSGWICAMEGSKIYIK